MTVAAAGVTIVANAADHDAGGAAADGGGGGGGRGGGGVERCGGGGGNHLVVGGGIHCPKGWGAEGAAWTHPSGDRWVMAAAPNDHPKRWAKVKTIASTVEDALGLPGGYLLRPKGVRVFVYVARGGGRPYLHSIFHSSLNLHVFIHVFIHVFL